MPSGAHTETCLVDDGDGSVGLAKVDTKDGRLGPVHYGERVLFGLVCLHFGEKKRSGNVNVVVDEDVFAGEKCSTRTSSKSHNTWPPHHITPMCR